MRLSVSWAVADGGSSQMKLQVVSVTGPGEGAREPRASARGRPGRAGLGRGHRSQVGNSLPGAAPGPPSVCPLQSTLPGGVHVSSLKVQLTVFILCCLIHSVDLSKKTVSKI